MVDVHVPNGSASTIDMVSNPPSSAAAPGQAVQDHMQQHNEADSPVLQIKRNSSRTDGPNANGRRSPSDTPGSQPRNFASIARETYSNSHHLFSSPAIAYGDHVAEDCKSSQAASIGRRWNGNGMRHLTAAAPPVRAQEQSNISTVSSRNEPSRTPLSQRGGLGAVSVGSGSVLFGR